MMGCGNRKIRVKMKIIPDGVTVAKTSIEDWELKLKKFDEYNL
jgi:hypothetical protein